MMNFSMLYESDAFVVVSLTTNPFAPIFEIVDKRTEKELCLHGAWAKAFVLQINRWQVDIPEQCEVEAVLENYSTLAQLPLITH